MANLSAWAIVFATSFLALKNVTARKVIRISSRGWQTSSPIPKTPSKCFDAAEAEYWAIRDRIFDLLRQADKIATRIHSLHAGGSSDRPQGPEEWAELPEPASPYKPRVGSIGALCVALLAQRWSD
jgi:hypothetical protein